MSADARNIILVTGGAGFIGSNLVRALQSKRAADIVVCDRLGRDNDKWRNLAACELTDWMEPEELSSFLEAPGTSGRIGVVVHLGAVSSTMEPDADLIMQTNFSLTMRLWDWCSANQVRLIYASSAATYGDGADGFDDDSSPEALARLRPLNVYGLSKHLADRRIARIIANGGPRPPQWVGLKFFNVYGPNEAHKGDQQSAVLQFYRQVEAGGPARLFCSHRPEVADGDQRRDFVWIGDAVAVILWLLNHEGISGLFNVGTSQARSFNDLARALFAALDREPWIEYVEMPVKLRDCYQYITEARTDRLRKVGYSAPFTPLEEGVRRYVHGYLEVGSLETGRLGPVDGLLQSVTPGKKPVKGVDGP